MAEDNDNEWFLQLSDYTKLKDRRLELLPDTCFWKTRLQKLIKNRRLLTKLGISEHGIYLFAGPSGNGRHITGSALAGSLMASYGLEPEETGFLALRADDFPKGMKAAEVSELITSVLEDQADARLRILVLEDMDQYAYLPAISNAIADTIEQMEEDSEDASEEEKARLVVIGYITDETLLTPDFRSQALILRLPCPSEHQREEYLESQLEWQVDNPENPMVAIQAALTLENITVSELAGQTDGMTYAELEQLVCYLKLSAMERMVDAGISLNLTCGREEAEDCIHMAKLPNVASGQMPVIKIEQTAAASSATNAKGPENNDRAMALMGKSDRSFSENMELLDFARSLG